MSNKDLNTKNIIEKLLAINPQDLIENQELDHKNT